MRALWSDRQNCSHNVAHKVKRIRRLSGFECGICGGCFGGQISCQFSTQKEFVFKFVTKIERGEKTPTPKISALLRKQPVLPRANFVLAKDRKRPYYGHFCGKMPREGSCSKAAGGP